VTVYEPITFGNITTTDPDGRIRDELHRSALASPEYAAARREARMWFVVATVLAVALVVEVLL